MWRIAVGNAERLARLVNDILELERAGSGQAELDYSSFPVHDLFRRATDLLQASAAKANLRFVLKSNDVTVWADFDRILQTLSNLISNAIKFSPAMAENETSVITLRALYIGGGRAQIEVQDHGRGIPPDKLQQIFERFQQVDASDSRTRGGTGLGLAICRTIVQQHGGQIWATSVPGDGSTFFFTLPLQQSSHLQ